MALVLRGEHPERGPLYAGVDPGAHHVKGRVAPLRFAAFLAPFRSDQDAREALLAAGAMLSAGKSAAKRARR